MNSYRKPRAAEGGELVFSRDELPGRVSNPQGSLLNTGECAHLDLEGGVTIIITEEALNSEDIGDIRVERGKGGLEKM